MEKRKEFDKQVLTRYIQNECERQLFLDLSRSKPDLWRKPNRKLENPKRIRRSSDYLIKLGSEYEQKVYKGELWGYINFTH